MSISEKEMNEIRSISTARRGTIGVRAIKVITIRDSEGDPLSRYNLEQIVPNVIYDKVLLLAHSIGLFLTVSE